MLSIDMERMKEIKTGLHARGYVNLDDMNYMYSSLLSQQEEIEGLKNKHECNKKCLTCSAKQIGSGEFCIVYCKYNYISDLNNKDLDNYESMEKL